MRVFFFLLAVVLLVHPAVAQTQDAHVQRLLQSPSNVLRQVDPQLQQLVKMSYDNAALVVEQKTATNPALQLPTTSGVMSNTLNFPWRYVGYLEIRREKNVNGTCTGTMVSPRVVLTAAHCFYDDKLGYLTDVTFVPARNGGLEPLGRYKAKKTVFLSPIAGKLNTNFDLAFVILEDSPFKDAAAERFVPVGIVTDEHFKPNTLPLTIIAAGYPTDKAAMINRGILTVSVSTSYRNPKEKKYRTVDGFSETTNQFEHKALSEEGTSGGPVFVYHPGYNQFALVGVISLRRVFDDGSEWAAAIKINSFTQQAIQKALRQYDPPVTELKEAPTSQTTNR